MSSNEGNNPDTNWLTIYYTLTNNSARIDLLPIQADNADTYELDEPRAQSATHVVAELIERRRFHLDCRTRGMTVGAEIVIAEIPGILGEIESCAS